MEVAEGISLDASVVRQQGTVGAPGAGLSKSAKARRKLKEKLRLAELQIAVPPSGVAGAQPKLSIAVPRMGVAGVQQVLAKASGPKASFLPNRVSLGSTIPSGVGKRRIDEMESASICRDVDEGSIVTAVAAKCPKCGKLLLRRLAIPKTG